MQDGKNYGAADTPRCALGGSRERSFPSQRAALPSCEVTSKSRAKARIRFLRSPRKPYKSAGKPKKIAWSKDAKKWPRFAMRQTRIF